MAFGHCNKAESGCFNAKAEVWGVCGSVVTTDDVDSRLEGGEKERSFDFRSILSLRRSGYSWKNEKLGEPIGLVTGDEDGDIVDGEKLLLTPEEDDDKFKVEGGVGVLDDEETDIILFLTEGEEKWEFEMISGFKRESLLRSWNWGADVAEGVIDRGICSVLVTVLIKRKVYYQNQNE